jgi:hypothetical protein
LIDRGRTTPGTAGSAGRKFSTPGTLGAADTLALASLPEVIVDEPVISRPIRGFAVVDDRLTVKLSPIPDCAILRRSSFVQEHSK